MCGQGERDFVPTDINVGVMPCFLGQPGDGVHEPDRSRKILELEGARDGDALLFPVGHGAECGLDLGGIEFGHVALVPQESWRVTLKLRDWWWWGLGLRLREYCRVIPFHFAHEADAGEEGPKPCRGENGQAGPADPAHRLDFHVALDLSIELPQDGDKPEDEQGKSGQRQEQLAGAADVTTSQHASQAGRGKLVDEDSIARHGRGERFSGHR